MTNFFLESVPLSSGMAVSLAPSWRNPTFNESQPFERTQVDTILQGLVGLLLIFGAFKLINHRQAVKRVEKEEYDHDHPTKVRIIPPANVDIFRATKIPRPVPIKTLDMMMGEVVMKIEAGKDIPDETHT